MDIRDQQKILSFAGERLENAPQQKRIVFLYAIFVLGIAAVVSVADYLLGMQISQTGGLSNLDNRALLSLLRQLLPVSQFLVGMCLELGYLAAMLRVARGQYVSPNTLRLGFDRFWPLLRLNLIQGLLFGVIGFVCIYIGCMIYLMTPMAKPLISTMMPLVSQSSLDPATMNPTALLNDEAFAQISNAILPMTIIGVGIFLLAVMPLAYLYRMAPYVLIDKPGTGALRAMGESWRMMWRSGLSLLKLDLRLWWYYAAMILTMIIAYSDQLLPLVGVELPFSATAAYFGFYSGYLILQFLLYYFLRNRVETTYALAYDAIRPQEPKQQGVVLGNIFQM